MRKTQVVRLTRGGGGAQPFRLIGTPETTAFKDVIYGGFEIQAVGGLAPYSNWTLMDAPAGLALTGTGAARTLAGTPALDGVFHITVTAEDAAGRTAPFVFDLTVDIPATPPFPATQAISWGGKTMVGLGGHDLGYTGTGALAITSQTNGGGAVSLWTINSEKKLTTTGVYGAAAPAYSGPYTVVVNDGAFTSTVTINIVDHRFDVAARATDSSTNNELRKVLYQANCTVNFGDTVALRNGIYATSKWTFTKPTQFTQRAGGPAAPVRIVDLDEEVRWTIDNDDGWVTITSDTAFGAKIRNCEFSGATVSAQYIRAQGLHFERFNTTGSNAVSTCAVQLAAGGTGTASYFRLKGNRLSSRVEGGGVVTVTNISSGFRTTNGAAFSEVLIEDNEFFDVFAGIAMTADYVSIEGNIIRDNWNDNIKGRLTNYKIKWNDMYNHKNYYVENPAERPHPDYFQQSWARNGAGVPVAGNYAGGVIVGNRMFRGDAGSDIADGQCIFIATFPSDVFLTDMLVRGNFCNGSKQRALQLSNCIDPVIEWNTGVSPETADPGSRRLYAISGTGGQIRFNAFEDYEVTNPSATFEQNVTVPLGSYAAAYVNPIRDAESDPAVMEARYAMKAGGSLDAVTTGFAANSGCFGTGYIDYDARTTNWPSV